MEELTTIITAIALIWLWVDVARMELFFKKTPIGMAYRNDLFMWLDRKPINCGVCLSFWAGIILAICLNQIIFLSLPLIFHLLKKIA